MKKWYNLTESESLEALSTDRHRGLSSSEVATRLEKYGRNELEQGEKKSLISKLIDQFKDPMILILLAASAISAFVGEIEDTFIILAIVVLNAFLSLYQEGKAEAAIESLQKMSAPTARVIRDGNTTEVSSTELVPGDIIILETGSIVPADIRILESSNLKIDESSLTGESVPVEKDGTVTYEGEMEIGDRENLGYSSTIVTYGRCTGVVVETGKNTEIGKIATSIMQVEEEATPLQVKLAGLSKILGYIVIGVCAIVFVVGLLHDMEFMEILMTSISLAVAAIPEGLPAIVTIVLSLGMGRMAEKNAIVKKLLAVETLGTTTVICSDKTGTLTQNEMTVVKAYVNGQVVDVSGSGYDPIGEFSVDGNTIKAEEIHGLTTLMGISTLVNDAELNNVDGAYKMIGDPTEGALLSFSGKNGITKVGYDETFPRIDEIPFDSARKMMTTFHEGFFEGQIAALTKGAPDIIIDKCSNILIDNKVVEFTPELKAKALEMNKNFARSALRVLAFAERRFDEIPEEKTTEFVEKDMTFVGLTGMIDPPRPEVKLAIQECKQAGIVPIMITGDHLDTAYAIGKDLGIAEDDSQSIMGRELNQMSDEELRQVVKNKRIFARVSPENKVQIVTALKENGDITAMTGDGVNDAPAIKKADIGIAMGITGTDVAKNTAEVILTDDNFATIVHAVEEGRIIYSNIKKFVSFLLSCNIGEVLIVFLSIVFNLPVPLAAKQLLWVNLVTDSLPAMALGLEKGDEDIMNEPPRSKDEGILDKDTIKMLILQAVAITAATLGAYLWGLQNLPYSAVDMSGPRTMAFVTLIMAELFRSYSARSDKYTIFHIGPFTNKRLTQATVVSFLLMLVVLYVPALNGLFETFPMGAREWMIALPAALIPLVVGEIYKAIKFKH